MGRRNTESGGSLHARDMERQIKFRAKRLDNGKWAYGGLIEADDYCIIDQYNELYVERDYVFRGDTHFFQLSGVMCDEKTIGQFTGLHDKNRKEVYEGDILQCPSEPNIPLEVRYNAIQGAFCLVEHTHTEGALLGTSPLGEMLRHYPDMRIIGNRFDNPSLISDKQ